MKTYYISEEQAEMFVLLGFDTEKWSGPTYLKLFPETKHSEWDESQYMMVEITDGVQLPKLRLDQALSWFREELGIDIVVSPRFNSNTGDRIGYFWYWSQRTDIDKREMTFARYEYAQNAAIDEVFRNIIPSKENPDDGDSQED